MRSTDLVVKQYGNNDHILGRGLEQEEADLLLRPLRQRLHSNEKDLDLSPASLKRLEHRLVALNKNMLSQDVDFTDDELVQFVREVAAYLGLVLTRHANGKWRGGKQLWTSQVDIPGPIRVVDGKASYTSAYPMIIFLGHIAAVSWELIKRGMKPQLFSTFSAAKRKISEQDLKPKN